MEFLDFQTLVATRFSVRKFQKKPIEHDKLRELFEVVKLAPSAANFQPWKFIVLNEPPILSEVQSTYHNQWLQEAPVLIIACADHSQSWKRKSDGKDAADIDVAIAVDHLTLQAANMGLGTCWVCNFDVKKCAKLLELPEYIEPIALIPIGYPDTAVPAKKRKELSEFVYMNCYGEPFR